MAGSSFLPKSGNLTGGILFKGSSGRGSKTGPRNPPSKLNALARGLIRDVRWA